MSIYNWMVTDGDEIGPYPFNDGGVTVYFYPFGAWAETAPEAICLAALKAVEANVSERLSEEGREIAPN